MEFLPVEKRSRCTSLETPGYRRNEKLNLPAAKIAAVATR
jgi:hypothetical protein